MFDAIAHRYDLLNHILSGGIDVYWRWQTVRRLAERRPRRILDVATGTADLAIAALRAHPDEIVAVDISENMLAIGRQKIARKNAEQTISLQSGAAEHLPFQDASFDAAMVAFGVRNFEDLSHGLLEMHRILTVGGSVFILEFSKPNSFPLKQIYFFYFTHILPRIGGQISQDRAAYEYLPETVLKFPDGANFIRLLEAAGFSRTTQTPMTFGIVTLYTGIKGE
jgi:demethylmenaquinone methyltransferase/2-methoxy-6-polyprenyl-1,4-benzoquinol methylase